MTSSQMTCPRNDTTSGCPPNWCKGAQYNSNVYRPHSHWPPWRVASRRPTRAEGISRGFGFSQILPARVQVHYVFELLYQDWGIWMRMSVASRDPQMVRSLTVLLVVRPGGFVLETRSSLISSYIFLGSKELSSHSKDSTRICPPSLFLLDPFSTWARDLSPFSVMIYSEHVTRFCIMRGYRLLQ